jgi:hypothetical protein
MTAKHNHHRKEAIVAVAALSAGLLSTALAVYTQTDPLAFTSEPSVATDGDALSGEIPESTTPEFLPRLEGQAASELAELDLAPMTIVGGRSHPRLTMARIGSKPSCVEHWRSLQSGPVGRHVLVTCPGASNAPPPPVSTRSSGGELQLPTIATFNDQLPAMQLPADLVPNAERANLASARVDAGLRRRWHGVREGTTGGARDVAVLPLQNPFSWAPTEGDVS